MTEALKTAVRQMQGDTLPPRATLAHGPCQPVNFAQESGR